MNDEDILEHLDMLSKMSPESFIDYVYKYKYINNKKITSDILDTHKNNIMQCKSIKGYFKVLNDFLIQYNISLDISKCTYTYKSDEDEYGLYYITVVGEYLKKGRKKFDLHDHLEYETSDIFCYDSFKSEKINGKTFELNYTINPTDFIYLCVEIKKLKEAKKQIIANHEEMLDSILDKISNCQSDANSNLFNNDEYKKLLDFKSDLYKLIHEVDNITKLIFNNMVKESLGEVIIPTLNFYTSKKEDIVKSKLMHINSGIKKAPLSQLTNKLVEISKNFPELLL